LVGPFPSCKLTVCKLFLDITKKDIRPDVIFRLGALKTGENRLIKVKFLSIRERNLVLKQWSLVKETLKQKDVYASVYLNEDLPYTIRRDHALLRKGRNFINDNGKGATIDWKARTLDVEDGSKYFVNDGKLICKAQAKHARKSKPDEIEEAVNFQERSLPRKRLKTNAVEASEPTTLVDMFSPDISQLGMQKTKPPLRPATSSRK